MLFQISSSFDFFQPFVSRLVISRDKVSLKTACTKWLKAVDSTSNRYNVNNLYDMVLLDMSHVHLWLFIGLGVVSQCSGTYSFRINQPSVHKMHNFSAIPSYGDVYTNATRNDSGIWIDSLISCKRRPFDIRDISTRPIQFGRQR